MKLSFNKKIQKISFIMSLLMSSIVFYSCSTKVDSQKVNFESESATQSEDLLLLDLSIKEEQKFGGVYIEKTTDEFNDFGFVYGDSVDVIFSNGYEALDIPYYSGYYAKTGEILLAAYPGYDYIDLCINNGDSLWERGKFKNTDTVNIKLRKRGKYKKNQDLLNIKYTNNREDYVSDEVFANFRNVKLGNIKENILYRGASPIDNGHKRASYANDLMQKANVKYDVDLSDTEKDFEKHFNAADFKSNYFKSLYMDNKVSVTPLSMNYKSSDFGKKVAKALIDMSKNEGPYYIHCVEGKDRTGFVLAVIEGLAGATYEEIVNDYMKTYENYYGVDKIKDKEKYNAIKENCIDDMLRFIADSDPYTGNGTIELEYLDWTNIMGRYLNKNGMSDEDIFNWYEKVTSDDYSDPD